MNCGVFLVKTAQAVLGLCAMADVCEQYMAFYREELAARILRHPATVSDRGVYRPLVLMAASTGGFLLDPGVDKPSCSCAPSCVLAVLTSCNFEHDKPCLLTSGASFPQDLALWEFVQCEAKTLMASAWVQRIGQGPSSVAVSSSGAASSSGAIFTTVGLDSAVGKCGLQFLLCDGDTCAVSGRRSGLRTRSRSLARAMLTAEAPANSACKDAGAPVSLGTLDRVFKAHRWALTVFIIIVEEGGMGAGVRVVVCVCGRVY